MSLLAEVMTSISQTADLRISRYFPARVLVGEYHLGSQERYELQLEFIDAQNQVVDVQTYEIEPAPQMVVVGNSFH